MDRHCRRRQTGIILLFTFFPSKLSRRQDTTMTKQAPIAKKKAAKIGSKKSKDSGKMPAAITDPRRASWAVYEEFDLLDLYAKARGNPSLTTDKRLKTKAWRDLADALNSKHKRTLEKAQYKLGRIMRDYDMYKEIRGLSGVGVCIHTGKLTFPDDVWDALIEAKPKKQHSKIIQLRDSGFEHEVICSMVAGDLRATGSEADSSETLLARMMRAEDTSHASPQRSSEEVGTLLRSDDEEDDGEAPQDTPDAVSRATLPPSNEQRLDNVRRIRDGASRTRREQKATADKTKDEKALRALLKTAQMYFEFKLEQEMGSNSALFEDSISDGDQLQADV